jgi:hypothetical protein
MKINKKTKINPYKKIKRDLMLRDNATNDRRFVSKVVDDKKKKESKNACKNFKFNNNE